MSRFLGRSRFAALACLGAAVLSGPVLADAPTTQAADSCPQWAVRTAAGCRVVKRHGPVEARRLPFVAEARDAFAGSRYVSLLILGVGF